jgi:hypothetical protein
MIRAIKKFSKKLDHGDSAIVVVLTHGLQSYLCGIDCRYKRENCVHSGKLIGVVEVDDFVSRLNAQHCEQLRGKPKLFLLQACHGSKSARSSIRLKCFKIDLFKPRNFCLFFYFGEVILDWKDNRRMRIDDTDVQSVDAADTGVSI